MISPIGPRPHSLKATGKTVGGCRIEKTTSSQTTADQQEPCGPFLEALQPLSDQGDSPCWRIAPIYHGPFCLGHGGLDSGLGRFVAAAARASNCRSISQLKAVSPCE